MRFLLLCILLSSGSMTPVYAQQPKAITNSIGMKLVLIHPGFFTMGSRIAAKGADFGTPHEVAISNPYYLGVCEVTQDQYEKVMGHNDAQFRGGTFPVETVSWNEAVSFCKKLSDLPEEKALGRIYRLPSEAEWEYACRASSGSRYASGDDRELLLEYAWIAKNAERTTHPVGEKKANRWGLYDMHGNVFEWCQDLYEVHPSDSVSDPAGPHEGDQRVFRGGSFLGEAESCISSLRLKGAPTDRKAYIGYRVAMSVPTKQPEATSAK